MGRPGHRRDSSARLKPGAARKALPGPDPESDRGPGTMLIVPGPLRLQRSWIAQPLCAHGAGGVPPSAAPVARAEPSAS